MTKQLTVLLGVVLTLIGAAGFFVEGSLFVFQVDVNHNIVHLASGVIGLLAAAGGNEDYARTYLLVFGIVYALVTIVGFAMGGDILGLFTVNTADNYLHLVIAVAALGVGFTAKKPRPAF